MDAERWNKLRIHLGFLKNFSRGEGSALVTEILEFLMDALFIIDEKMRCSQCRSEDGHTRM